MLCTTQKKLRIIVLLGTIVSSFSIKPATQTHMQLAEISDAEAQDIIRETNEHRQKLSYRNAGTEEFLKLAAAIPQTTNEELQQLKKDIIEQVTKFSHHHHERQASNAPRASLSQKPEYTVAELEAKYKELGERPQLWKLESLLESVHNAQKQSQNDTELKQLNELTQQISKSILAQVQNRSHFAKAVNKTKYRSPKEKKQRERAKSEAEEAMVQTPIRSGTATTRINATSSNSLLSAAAVFSTMKPRQQAFGQPQSSSSSNASTSNASSVQSMVATTLPLFHPARSPIEKFEQRFEEIKRTPALYGKLPKLLEEVQKAKKGSFSPDTLKRYHALESEIKVVQAKVQPTIERFQAARQKVSVQPDRTNFKLTAELPIAPKDAESETTKVCQHYRAVGTLFDHDKQ